MSGVAASVNRWLLRPQAKPLIFMLLLTPAGWLLWGAMHGLLGANPAEALVRGTGDWTLRCLWLTLTVTPLRQVTGWHALARWRRMLGLYAFFYGVLHFLCFAWLDMGLDWQAIVRDIGKRPFILVGTAALLLMLPLAVTSIDRVVKAIGAVRWRALHRLVYAVALLGLLHFFWMRAAKNDFGEWAVYATLLVLLFAWRLRKGIGRPAPR